MWTTRERVFWVQILPLIFDLQTHINQEVHVQILPVCFDDTMAFQSSPLQNEKMSVKPPGNNSTFFYIAESKLKAWI